jgi:MFS family permease
MTESHSVYSQLHHPNDDPSGTIADKERDPLVSRQLKRNFYLFSIFYSLVHAAVDCVLAFSSAELGTSLGSYGGFVLYIFYTFSSLFLAKPILSFFVSSKIVVLFGLLGMFCYVIGFYFSLLFLKWKYVFFLVGAAIGGIGAGFLWTAQSIYYTMNATLFSYHKNENKVNSIYQFAAIFAIFYLLLEAVLQFTSTFIFWIYSNSTTGDDDERQDDFKSWRPLVFGIYTAIAFICLILYYGFIMDFRNEEETERNSEKERNLNVLNESDYNHVRNTEDDEEQISPRDRDERSPSVSPRQSLERKKLTGKSSTKTMNQKFLTTREPSTSSSTHTFYCLPCRRLDLSPHAEETTWSRIFAVTLAIYKLRKLQCLLPFQIAFGLSAGLIQTYVNGVIVNDNIGDGYIGLLSGCITLTAVLIAQPLALTTRWYPNNGKTVIMIIGSVAFTLNGLFLIVFSNSTLSSWAFIVFYYILHGIARGIWENTNKGIIAEFFSNNTYYRDAAFASIYFASGFSGALGFLFFQFLSKNTIATINCVVSVIALLGYLYASYLHENEIKQELLSNIHSLIEDDSVSDKHNDSFDKEGDS